MQPFILYYKIHLAKYKIYIPKFKAAQKLFSSMGMNGTWETKSSW